MMIAAEMAQKFVDRFCSTIRYNVNVMDMDGIIIAARDTHRIGMYHEIAHTLVLERRDMAVVDSGDTKLPGVLPGVNLPLRHRGEIIGVVGVTGSYPDVVNVAHTVRTAIEVMLEYERERKQIEHRQDRKKFFINMLLYKETPEPVQLIGLARRCGYDPSLPRMAVVLEVPEAAETYDYLRAVKSSSEHTRQDISFIGSTGHITVFKAVPIGSTAIVSTIRRCFLGYCTAVDRECVAVGLDRPQKYASGPVQDSLIRYRSALRSALWTLHRDGDRLAFFTDHAQDLLLNSIAPDVWHTVFDYLLARMRTSHLIDTAMLDQLGRTFMALREENMSYKRAALRLDVHRNTVVFRLNRLNDLFGLDPVSNRHDRDMLYLFFSYLTRHMSNPAWLPEDSSAPFMPMIQKYLV